MTAKRIVLSFVGLTSRSAKHTEQHQHYHYGQRELPTVEEPIHILVPG